MKKINHIERRKNKVYIYFANPPGCGQPGSICEIYSSAKEAEERKKELKKIGYIYI